MRGKGLIRLPVQAFEASRLQQKSPDRRLPLREAHLQLLQSSVHLLRLHSRARPLPVQPAQSRRFLATAFTASKVLHPRVLLDEKWGRLWIISPKGGRFAGE